MVNKGINIFIQVVSLLNDIIDKILFRPLVTLSAKFISNNMILH